MDASIFDITLYDAIDLLVRQNWSLNYSWQPFIHVPFMWLHATLWKRFPHVSKQFSSYLECGQATKKTVYGCNILFGQLKERVGNII